MSQIYLPTLHTFAMKNDFTGSCGMFRFRVTPNVIMATAKEVDFTQSTIEAEFWHGLFCYEKSEILGEEIFPLSEEGKHAMYLWLKEHA